MGRIVFAWNSLERTLTSLLNVLIGGEHRAIIVTAHMGTNTQLDALKTIANEFLAGEELDHIMHVAALFERIRERRNHYVHSFNNISGDFDGTGFANPMGSLSGWSARGRLKQHVSRVGAKELADEANTMRGASHYMALVHNHFRYPNNADYRALPEKFPLPDKMTKPFRFVLDGQPPPQSSQG